MSIVKIFFNPLNLQDTEQYPITPGTQIIDFLVANYPNGFAGSVRVFVGVEEVAIEDLDRVVGEEELVTILVMPGGAEIAAWWAGFNLVNFLINTAIAIGISYALNALFGPKAPGSAKNEAESPVYSLNASRNVARLGDPVSVHYGTVSYPPDYAAAPYIWYSQDSNDMYVDELLCLGHGEFEIQEIYIGDTPVDIIERGSVQWWQFGPSDHAQRMGAIQTHITNAIGITGTTFPFRENVITSPEVESYDFNLDRSEIVDTAAPFAGIATATHYDPVSKLTVYGNISEVSVNLGLRTGDTLTLSGTANNNISILIASIVEDPNDAGLVTLYEAATVPEGTGIQDEDPLPGGTTYLLNNDANPLIAGPYRAQKLGQTVTVIDCDILFPQGLYRVDGTSGKIKDASVEMKITYQMINEDTGEAIAAPIEVTKTYHEKKRQPLRSTVTSWDIPEGAYEVTVERVTPVSDDDRIHDVVTWAGLKGTIAITRTPVYGNTTLVAVRMKATNGLGAAARERIRVTARRILPNAGNSDNPVVAMADVWTNTEYGLARPSDELDNETLFPLAIRWENEDGAPKFNGSFDQRSTGYEAMQSIMSSAAGKVVQYGGLTSVTIDEVQEVRKALFGSGNIAKSSLQIDYSFDTTSDYDGVQIEYRDPDTFQPAFVTYPSGATQPDTFVLFGCTDAVYAQQYARYMQNVKDIRRQKAMFTTELEGLIPRFGDRIGVSHNMPRWGKSGVIVKVLTDTMFMVDQDLPWDPDPDRVQVMMLRGDTGTPSDLYTVTRGSADNIVVFSEVPNVTVTGADFQEPTLYSFGINYAPVRDFIVSKITPVSDTTIELEGLTYKAQMYNGAPPHLRPYVDPNSLLPEDVT